MGPSPTYHPPEGGECETSVEHGLPLWAEPAVGYCSRRPRPSPMWGSRFVGARAVGPWVGERKPLGKTPCGATPVPSRPTYLPAEHANVSAVIVEFTTLLNVRLFQLTGRNSSRFPSHPEASVQIQPPTVFPLSPFPNDES